MKMLRQDIPRGHLAASQCHLEALTGKLSFLFLPSASIEHVWSAQSNVEKGRSFEGAYVMIFKDRGEAPKLMLTGV